MVSMIIGSKGKDFETHFIGAHDVGGLFSNIFSSQKKIIMNKTLNISFGKNRLSTTKTPSIRRLSIPNNTFDDGDDAFDGMSLSSTPTFVVVVVFFVEWWCAFDARENDDDVYDFVVVVDVIFFGRSGKSTKPTPKDDDDEKNANWCGRNAKTRKDEDARDDDDENLERVRRVVVDVGRRRRRRRRNFGDDDDDDDEGECTTFGKATVS